MAQAQEKTAEKPKAEKEKAPKFNALTDIKWEKSDYNGRKVYSGRGTGSIIAEGEHEGKKYFKILLDDGEETEIATTEKSVRFKAVNDEYRETYVVDKEVKTPSGASSIYTADSSKNVISRALLGLTVGELQAVAKENGLQDKFNHYLDNGLNPGMIRMNVGNILQARHKRKGQEGVADVTIFGKHPDKAADDREAQLVKEAEEAAKRKKAEAAKAAKEKAAKDEEKAEKAREKAAKAESKSAKSSAKAAKTNPKKDNAAESGTGVPS